MTAPHRDFDCLNPRTDSNSSNRAEQNSAKRQSQDRPRAEKMPLARGDNPDAPVQPARSHLRQPRTYTMPDFAPRRPCSRTDTVPTPEELDRWDAEWRDEWDRGDIDDSAAYAEDELDVAEQTRDVEWLLDALDALDDAGESDEYDCD